MRGLSGQIERCRFAFTVLFFLPVQLVTKHDLRSLAMKKASQGLKIIEILQAHNDRDIFTPRSQDRLPNPQAITIWLRTRYERTARWSESKKSSFGTNIRIIPNSEMRSRSRYHVIKPHRHAVTVCGTTNQPFALKATSQEHDLDRTACVISSVTNSHASRLQLTPINASYNT